MGVEVKTTRSFIGRIKNGKDLCGALTDFCVKENISFGTFSVIGAVKNVTLGYYDQDDKKYNDIKIEKPLEIAACTGNISSKDGEVFVHAHINVSDDKGESFGGHLMPGAEIFAAEFFIQELTPGTLERKFDDETGLSLWQEGII